MGRYTTSSAIYSTQIYRLSNSVVDTATVDYWINKAELEVDSYLAKQYTLPFSTVPAQVKSISEDVSACKIYKQYLYSGDNQNVNEWILELCEDTKDTLEKLAEGKIRLVGSTGSVETNVNTSMKSNLEDIPLIANMDDAYNWNVSNSLLTNISDGRELAD